MHGQFTLSESLSEEALQILLHHRLGEKRSPAAVKTLIDSRTAADESFAEIMKARDEEIKVKLEEQRVMLTSAIHFTVGQAVSSRFQYVMVTHNYGCHRNVLFS